MDAQTQTQEARQAQATAPVLLDATQAGALLSMSRSGFLLLHRKGRIPGPIRLGKKLVRWRRQELEAWAAAGCPWREAWDPQNFKRTA